MVREFTYAAAHKARPSSVSLILASTAESFELRQLIGSLPADFSGSLVIAFIGSGNSLRQLQSQLKLTTKFKSRIAAKSQTLEAGQIIWLDDAHSYRINEREQLVRSANTDSSKLQQLIESLATQFGPMSSFIPLSIVNRNLCLKLAVDFHNHRGVVLLPASLALADPDYITLLNHTIPSEQTLEPWELADALQHLSSKRKAGEPKGRVMRPTFEKILNLMYQRKHTDFSAYREASLISRIEHRLETIGERDLDNYYARLQSEKEELNELYRELLVGTTTFFRQSKAFEHLYETLDGYLSTRDSLRIWSAGCSTGEEAYSIALLTDKLVKSLGRPIEVTIYATDLNSKALEVAKKGLYSKRSIEAIPEEYLPQHLQRKDGLYDIASSVRAKVLFNNHNLLEFPPLRELDLIVCRNLLIYFNPSKQDELITGFHKMLKPAGLLMLGQSESTGTSRSLFVPVQHASKIYKALSFEPIRKN